ncbi:MAG: hypothetical protein AAFY64_07295 [Pseudomonadota bacterium]
MRRLLPECLWLSIGRARSTRFIGWQFQQKTALLGNRDCERGNGQGVRVGCVWQLSGPSVTMAKIGAHELSRHGEERACAARGSDAPLGRRVRLSF